MSKKVITEEELSRYSRQLPLIGEEGQEKLKKTKILIAGAGGLGSPIATYLALAGVGCIVIVDSDNVEVSNLNRQTLHWSADVGRKKTVSAKEKLRTINPYVEVETISCTIGETNVNDVVADADLIIDALDNFATRYLLNSVAVLRNIPFFHGAVRGFHGHVMTIIPNQTACLRCVFPQSPPAEIFPIIGVTPGVIGSIQATEVIKYITGKGELLTNKLLLWDGLSGEMNVQLVKKNPSCKDCSRLK
ncbi:dinucleotide-utilizing enzymes involved in molybdopterin and thiamine biosynthesis family 2 [hydrocarbon metagenome]|uniref:Dinucleotide-utilizing enzymes involved in molybdopterin and thiamine biosynthesis family 2 n=1 Tax=hydrocarbon metagenome TaxID=938273 RepID=A0A0W8FNJ6_9ZZZZ